MVIKKLNKLNSKQIKNVLELIAQCRADEPTNIAPTLTNEGNFDPDLPCMFLCEENGYLISFVSIFMPSPYYGEVVGFTFPAARNRGYFMKTWLAALQTLGPHIEDMEIMFVTDGKSPSALKTFEALKMHYEYSEFVLAKDIVHNEKGLTLTAKPLDANDPADANAIFMLHTNIFADGKSETLTFIDSTKQECAQNFLAVGPDGKPVGLFHMALDGDRVFLFGVGVLPEYQRKGYGKQIVQLAMNLCDETFKSMGLQVSSLNEEAMRLYKSCGFQEVNRLDYYFDEM
ncbi:MAG: GNAT family N-acetyltransferase [Lachnospiraceae bacterium]|nr:GNAT family N-acetyltransferase [Lachnospiraceae bacterium]